MTAELIALLLAQPLKVRLALLDADPKGAGWYRSMSNGDGKDNGGSIVEHGPNGLIRQHTARGLGAWLPCNPLAIAEHAARLRFGAPGWFATIAADHIGSYRAFIEDKRGDDARDAEADDPYTAAVRLLAEVVGG